MTNNKQSSSVEWLICEIIRHQMTFYGTSSMPLWIIEQAKAMHKEEIIKAMSTAFIDGAKIGAINYESPFTDWEHYYNETFGNEQTN